VPVYDSKWPNYLKKHTFNLSAYEHWWLQNKLCLFIEEIIFFPECIKTLYIYERNYVKI
jgi:hypothetical protein